MNLIKCLKKEGISVIIVIMVLTIFNPHLAYSQTERKETKIEKMKAKQLKLDERKKRREERKAKMRKRKKVLNAGRFNILSPKMAEKIAKSSKSVLKVDADFGGLFLVKSIFINADTTGQNFIYIQIETLDSRPAIYNFNMKILDKSGKELAGISTPVSASGRKLRKGQVLLGRFKIEDAITPKISDYAISFKIPVDPVLKSGGKEVLRVKAK